MQKGQGAKGATARPGSTAPDADPLQRFNQMPKISRQFTTYMAKAKVVANSK